MQVEIEAATGAGLGAAGLLGARTLVCGLGTMTNTSGGVACPQRHWLAGVGAGGLGVLARTPALRLGGQRDDGEGGAYASMGEHHWSRRRWCPGPVQAPHPQIWRG